MVYTGWRGLSNRPARGTLIASIGTCDCGRQVQSEACWGQLAEVGVRPVGHLWRLKILVSR